LNETGRIPRGRPDPPGRLRRSVLGTLLPSLAVATLQALSGACGAPIPLPDRPDLVLVSLDTLRSDHLSLYGYGRPTSPELDRYAAESCLTFDGSISTSTWTLPTHATMFTGLLPGEHGLTDTEHRLADDVPTVAELLRDVGYRTAAITDGGYMAPLWGLERGFGAFRTPSGAGWEPKDASVTFDLATREVEGLARADAPYFLFVHSYETHQPYELRPGFSEPFVDPTYRGAFEDAAVLSSRFAGELPAVEVRRMIDLYDGEIRRLDHFLVRFLERLRSESRDRKTFVIVTSDHGEAFGEHGTWEHGLGRVEDEHVRVPLLLCGPGSGRGRSAVRTTTLDVAPTLLALAGVAPPRRLLGARLMDLEADRDRWAIAHGFDSLPAMDEEWLRLEGDDGTLIVDLARGLQTSPEATGEALRARALLLLARGRIGESAALLPYGVESLRWRPDGPLPVAGRLDDRRWRPVATPPGSESMRLDPEATTLLFLRGVESGGTLARSPGAREISLAPGLDPGGQSPNPLEDREVTRWLVRSNGLLSTPRTALLDDATIEQLRALGYL